MIRLTVPSIDQDDLRAVQEVLASGYLVQGARVADFERTVAEYVGTDHAVAVANCTAALHLALLAVGVGRGDRVAVTGYSWPATANVIALCGAEPVFVDINPSTFNMDPEALHQVLRRTNIRAVLPVHAFGALADMKRIGGLAQDYGVPLVEDAACALGAELEGRRAGAWGTVGCFSFHPRKPITTGEGGMLTTNDVALARTLRVLRNHGLDPDAPAPEFVAAGFNLRLTEFQAALGTSQMRKLDRLIGLRRAQAATYDRLLRNTDITPPQTALGNAHVYQSYVVLLPPAAAPRRPQLIAALKERGIETTIGTYHLPLIKYIRDQYGFRPGDFRNTDDVAVRAVSLPLFEDLSTGEQELIVDSLVELSVGAANSETLSA